MVKVVKDCLSLLNLRMGDMQSIATDNAAYCGKAYRLLKAEHPTLLWIRCAAHGFNLVLRALCSPFQDVDDLVADLKAFFVKGFGLRRRISSFEDRFKRSPLGIFCVTETRWSEWVKAVQWTSLNSKNLAAWMKDNGSSSTISNRIGDFLGSIDRVAALHAIAACTTELMQLIVDTQGDPLTFLSGERGNLFLRIDAMRSFLQKLQDPEFAEAFVVASFLTHREEPGGSSFGEQFAAMGKEEKQAVVVMCSQGAIPACEKFDKHIRPTLDSLRVARYIVPAVACTMLGTLRESSMPPAELCSSIQCPGVDATFVNDWNIYVRTDLPAFLALSEEDRPSAISFWKSRIKSLPRLALFALRVLSLPLGTASAERAFSKLRDVQSPHRGSIGEQYTKMELVLSFNKELLW